MQLSVPNRTTPGKDAFDSTPSRVKTWIENLPMANIGETTRRLYSALKELNSQDIPGPQRFKALELVSKPVNFVNENLKKHFVGHPLPLELQKLKIAHLSRELSHEMATGYKILVMEQIAGVGRKDKKLLVTSIHRATRLLGSVLLKAYQVYESYPASTWLEIHSLYRYAEGNKIHKQRVADESCAETSPTTISDAYKQIILLALACPYRLRHNEAESVYHALELWSGLTELLPAEDNPKALFVVNLDSDNPPSYQVLRDASEKRSSRRVLNTATLAEHLRKLPGESSDNKTTAERSISADTLRRLMLAWGVLPKRRFSRTRDHSEVIVSMGLSSIHYFVSGEAAFNTASIGPECATDLDTATGPRYNTTQASFSARETTDRKDFVPDLWEMNFHLEGEQLPSTTEANIARAAAGIRIDPSHRTQMWKMVNVSAGGYCMLWDNMETTRAQVGELLGIREQSDPDTFHWRLAVIRWLKYVEKRGLELGVQMLSPGAIAIEACTEKSRATPKQKDFTRGLLLPEVASIQQQATLLLPSPPFGVGNTALVNCHGKEVRVKLTKLLENTGSFAQFQFASLGEVVRPGHKNGSSKPVPKDFDDVWDLL